MWCLGNDFFHLIKHLGGSFMLQYRLGLTMSVHSIIPQAGALDWIEKGKTVEHYRSSPTVPGYRHNQSISGCPSISSFPSISGCPTMRRRTLAQWDKTNPPSLSCPSRYFVTLTRKLTKVRAWAENPEWSLYFRIWPLQRTFLQIRYADSNEQSLLLVAVGNPRE